MKLPQIAATLVLGAACAMPAMAQSQGSGAPGKSSQPMSQPATQSSTADSTKSMGASPAQSDMGRTETRDKPDLGWLGLLGLAGLLGLRRKREDHHTEVHRTGTVR